MVEGIFLDWFPLIQDVTVFFQEDVIYSQVKANWISQLESNKLSSSGKFDSLSVRYRYYCRYICSYAEVQSHLATGKWCKDNNKTSRINQWGGLWLRIKKTLNWAYMTTNTTWRVIWCTYMLSTIPVQLRLKMSEGHKPRSWTHCSPEHGGRWNHGHHTYYSSSSGEHECVISWQSIP